LWTTDDVGEEFAYEYRPEGVYLFQNRADADRYAAGNGDVYEIDVQANGREIIRDPVSAQNWDYLDPEDQTYLTRYVEPDALRLVSDDVAKHGSHDQQSHGRGGAREVKVTDADSAWSAVMTDEARAIDDRKAAFPERYNPSGQPGYGLKDGAVETRVITREGPPRVQDFETHTSAGLTMTEAHEVDGVIGMGASGYGKPLVPVGDARPPQHVYRVMSTAEFDQARERGYIKSDERMNLGPGEGTVTSLRSTGSFYAPTDGSDYRVVRIKYDDSDGWRTDSDSYIKTDQRVPFDRVDLFTSPVSQSTVAKHGSHDQSSHNPHKGGASDLPEGWSSVPVPRTPVSTARPAPASTTTMTGRMVRWSSSRIRTMFPRRHGIAS
jgi:hypothetical protein